MQALGVGWRVTMPRSEASVHASRAASMDRSVQSIRPLLRDESEQLVALGRDEVRVHTAPSGDGDAAAYTEGATLVVAGVLRLAAFSEVAIEIAALLRSPS